MDSRRTVLAALRASPDLALTRVQAQKLLFLIDRSLSDRLGGAAFNFQPYHYGPFDKAVYWILEDLVAEGLVGMRPTSSGSDSFALTDHGRVVADSVLQSLPSDVRNGMGRLGSWVRSATFTQLVEGIYGMFPEMRVNSIFRR